MARKESMDRGNDNFSMLLDIIFNLTPLQADALYKELRTRYTSKGHTKYYNTECVQDKENGVVRLTEYQFRALQIKYGRRYLQHAIQEMTNYINWLKQHQDEPKYRSQLEKLMKRTHCKELDYGGWVYSKCHKYINKVDTQIIINPFVIEDVSVARRYIESLSPEMRKMPDVMWLVEKFPELNDLIE